MAYEWSPDEYAQLAPIVQDTRDLLERWYRAIESGTVAHWRADPMYPVVIEQSVCDGIIDAIERQFAHELVSWGHQEAAGSHDAGPGFDRLTANQRLALAQQLHSLKRKHSWVRPAEQPQPPAHPPYGWYPPPTEPPPVFVGADYIS